MVREVRERQILLLQILKSDNGFAFYPIEGLNVDFVWHIKEDPNNPSFFVIEKIQKGYVVVRKRISYKRLGVGNICELFKLFLIDSEWAYQQITGEQIKINEINVSNMSVNYKLGFESCSFYDKNMIYN
jgi:hypothetical protein